MSTTINKNLGHVTAYAYAKAGGYTGTEAQFQALLGNIAIDLAEIENLTVVVNTLPAGSSATSSYSDGVLTLGIPRGDTGEVSDADLAEALEDYVEKTTLDDYAQVDGYYSDMTVGDAEQLISSVYVEDAEPYGYRTTGGSADVGNREYIDAIVGGTVAFNQLLLGVDEVGATKWRAYSTNYGSVTYANGELIYTIVEAKNDAWSNGIVSSAFTKKKDHVLLVAHDIYVPKESRVNISYFQGTVNVVIPAGWNRLATIQKGSSAEDGSAIHSFFGIVNATNYEYVAGDIYKIKNAQIIDLTQMFGSAIADYIYSLEQANAGAGVAWFKKLFPKDYYEYNAGELISVSGLQSHDTVGFNMWDEEWEVGGLANATGLPFSTNDRIRSKNFSKCLPNTNYYCKTTSNYLRVFWYDSEQNFIRMMDTVVNLVITSPSNAHYFKIVLEGATTYNNDICINLSWSGWRNGEYEPYEKHSYALDSSLTLRGIPKLDASNNLYYDGDEYLSSGAVTRKYVEVVFDETIGINQVLARANTTRVFYNYTNMSYAMKPNASSIANIISDFPVYSPDYIYSNDVEGVSENRNPTQFGIWLSIANSKLSAQTADGVKAYLAQHPVSIVYELATPTTEQAEPYQNIQICDDFGTEEFVSTSIVPVGHQTRYPANLRDKLQHLPNLADNDGAYLIRQINKQMSLDLFRIPKAPTTDGTYTLKATVSGGTPTYTWEAEAEE